MQFNTLKCEVMTVTNKRKPIHSDYWLYGVQLKCKYSIKYLGLTIDSKLNFNEHINDKSTKASKVLNMIRRNLYFAPAKVKAKAYMAMVRPILEYGAVCWSPIYEKQKYEIEKVQNTAAKFVKNYYPKKDHYNEFSMSYVINDLG